jgi:glycosyltransferase involved in cell wall biosynthesis
VRVIHVTDVYAPRLGGIEIHVHDLAMSQRAQGIDAQVLTSTPAAGGTPDPSWVTRVAGTSADPAAALRSLLADDVVVHAHVSVLSPFTSRAARAAGVMGLPTAITIHSQWSHLVPLPSVATALLGLRDWPVTWSAVSSRAAEPIRAMLGPGSEVLVVPNAVDEQWWRAIAPRPAAVPTIISVMRFARTKRPLPLVRLLAGVRRRVPADQPLRAVVIGDGPRWEATRRAVRRHGMSDWVELPGRLEREDIRAALAQAHVFVAPAVLESFGIAALEARCVGLPVVASDRSGVGQFVTSGHNGFLTGTDTEMAEALARLVLDDEGRRAMAAANRARPSGHDWPVVLELVDGLYAHARASASWGARIRSNGERIRSKTAPPGLGSGS